MNLTSSLEKGLSVLWQAAQFAEDSGMELRQFAVEIESLVAAGMNKSEVRWLIAKGWVEHFQDSPDEGNGRLLVAVDRSLSFHSSSRFALSPQGIEFALSMEKNRANGFPDHRQMQLTLPLTDGDDHSQVNLTPNWDPKKRQLVFLGQVVKEFRVPAQNQVIVLCAFEEQGWSSRIDDPLPIKHSIDSHARLHDTLNRLNKCQINRIIQFGGDGTGTGAYWKPRSIHD